jgi:hypothetical protein
MIWQNKKSVLEVFMQTKFYQQTWFILTMLAVFFPIGIFLLWKYNKFKEPYKIILTLASCFVSSFVMIFSCAIVYTILNYDVVSANIKAQEARESQKAKDALILKTTIKPTSTPTSTQKAILEPTQEPAVTATPTKETTPTPEPKAEPIILGNGNFMAGRDFPAGTYDIVAVKGGGNVQSSNAFEGGINAIMGKGKGEMYEEEYKNIELPQGVTVTIDRVTVKLIKK